MWPSESIMMFALCLQIRCEYVINSIEYDVPVLNLQEIADQRVSCQTADKISASLFELAWIREFLRLVSYMQYSTMFRHTFLKKVSSVASSFTRCFNLSMLMALGTTSIRPDCQFVASILYGCNFKGTPSSSQIRWNCVTNCITNYHALVTSLT